MGGGLTLISAPASGDLVLVRTVLGSNLFSAALAFLRDAVAEAVMIEALVGFLKAVSRARFFCAGVTEGSDGLELRRVRLVARMTSLGSNGDDGGDEYFGRCWVIWVVGSCVGGGERMLEDTEERGEESESPSSAAMMILDTAKGQFLFVEDQRQRLEQTGWAAAA